MTWTITRDFVDPEDDWPRRKGTYGPAGASEDEVQAAARYGEQFRVCNEDGRVFYHGRFTGLITQSVYEEIISALGEDKYPANIGGPTSIEWRRPGKGELSKDAIAVNANWEWREVPPG